MDPAFPRLHVVTDDRPLETVRAVTAVAARTGACLAVQLRLGDHVTDRQAYAVAVEAVARCRPVGVLCLVNDRLDVAVAAGADGAHVGADDLPVTAARALLVGGPVTGGVLGATCREAVGARQAVADGATYLGVGPAFATTTKDGLPDPIGPVGVGAVAAAVPGTPVIAIGGVDVARAGALVAAGAYGVAVVGAVSRAADPERAIEELLKVLP